MHGTWYNMFNIHPRRRGNGEEALLKKRHANKDFLSWQKRTGLLT